MAALESLFSVTGTWFGFVGSCVAGTGLACRPFLAFVALTAAAGVALALLILAYRALQKEQTREYQEPRPSARSLQLREPVWHASEKKSTAQRVPAGAWQVTV